MAEIRSISGSKGEGHGVKEILAEAAEQNFESVFIVGYRDGDLHIKASGYNSLSKTIGLMEILKHHLINNT